MLSKMFDSEKPLQKVTDSPFLFYPLSSCLPYAVSAQSPSQSLIQFVTLDPEEKFALLLLLRG